MKTSDKHLSLSTCGAGTADFARVLSFYLDTGYTQPVDPADTLVYALREEEICAALRLCPEQNTLVLRGMRVCPDLRRQGVGTVLLLAAAKVIGERECYCIPHAYLESFYGQIGFREIDPDTAPAFLHKRLVTYRQVLVLDVILMRRMGVGP